jgi:CDP-glucose 4,6-dehydratase|tara:strand:+ start:2783 stop:3757 length:975 start_codon:yes stop_codon:yes gene_type:complete
MKEKDFWENKKVFVTGSTGFIGRWLVNELLSKGAKVFALVRNSADQTLRNKGLEKGILELIIGRVEDLDIIETAIRSSKIEIIFHLASKNINIGNTLSPLSTFETNLRGSYNLLEAVRRQSKQISGVILASSKEAEIYHGEGAKSREKRHPYEVSKTCVELIANAYADTFGLNIAIVRSENVYGGRDLNWNRLIPGTINYISKGKRPVIRSDGNIKRDYVYIKDVIDAYLRLGELIYNEKHENKIFYLGTEQNITTYEIVKKICRLMNVNPDHHELRCQGFDEREQTIQSTQKTRELLHWSPNFDIDTGLKETVEWYDNYFSKK